MDRMMPMVEARRKLTALPEELAGSPETDVVAVTRRGKPVLAIMPWELYAAIAETLEIMGDEELVASLRQSIRELAEGRTVPWDDVRRGLNV